MLPRANIHKSLFENKNDFPLQVIRILILFWNWIVTQRKYETETNPFRIVWVNPNSINRGKNHKQNTRLPICVVNDFDFDLEPIKELPREKIFLAIKSDNTKEIREWHSGYVSRKYKQGLTTEYAKIYFRNLENLFHSLKDNGFQPPPGVPEGKSGLENNCWPTSAAVNIGPEGGFFLHTGKHRVAAAKVLGIEKIPVRIVGRHIKWQQKREKIYRLYSENKFPETISEMLNHPDINYLIT